MNIKRIAKHLLTSDWLVNRHFPVATMAAIEQEIKTSENLHSGEIRFVVEGALDGVRLFKDQTAQARAIDIFSQLRIWDTELNNGVLIYLLLADRDIEIIADRGIYKKVGPEEWEKICVSMESYFKENNFHQGVISGIDAVTQLLQKHFPIPLDDKNELSNKPIIM
ncbi:MAG: TPM domain-containing protein [Pseudomonadota bacterium]